MRRDIDQRSTSSDGTANGPTGIASGDGVESEMGGSEVMESIEKGGVLRSSRRWGNNRSDKWLRLVSINDG